MHEEQEKVSKRALERWNNGLIDKEYVLLLAREVDRGRKTISKLQQDLIELQPSPEESELVFDEDACAEFIFKRLVERAIAVSIDDIRMIIDLEYEYGVQVGIYPPIDENQN